MIFHSFEYIVYYLLDYMGFSLSSQGKVLWGAAVGGPGAEDYKGKVLRMDRPLAGGFLSLTAFQAEGCGIALSGDEFYKPPAAVTSA